MSEDKVTPIPRQRGTPKSMRPPVLRLTYYLTAIFGIIHIILAVSLYYEAAIIGQAASALSVQPPALAAVIEFFAGIFGLVAAFGLRRLEYWGALSIAVFGAFEIWNSMLLKLIVSFVFSTMLGISISGVSGDVLYYAFLGIGILLIVLGGLSLIVTRRHKGVAAQMKG